MVTDAEGPVGEQVVLQLILSRQERTLTGTQGSNNGLGHAEWPGLMSNLKNIEIRVKIALGLFLIPSPWLSSTLCVFPDNPPPYAG